MNMDSKRQSPHNDERHIYFQRRVKQGKIARLSAFRQGYSVKLFMADFGIYFDNEIDFNMDKIRQRIQKKGVLEELIRKAIQHNTHPVTEFVQELFRELGRSGDVEWTGEL